MFSPQCFLEGYKEAKVLKAKNRAHIKTKNFALPQKAKTTAGKKKSGSYPIPDIEHARNALARVAQHGTDEEKAQVRAKVHAKYPSLGKSEKQAGLFGAALGALASPKGKRISGAGHGHVMGDVIGGTAAAGGLLGAGLGGLTGAGLGSLVGYLSNGKKGPTLQDRNERATAVLNGLKDGLKTGTFLGGVSGSTLGAFKGGDLARALLKKMRESPDPWNQEKLDKEREEKKEDKSEKQEKEGSEKKAEHYNIPRAGGNTPINDMVTDWMQMFRDGRFNMQEYRDRVNAENGKEAKDDKPCPGSKIRSEGKGRGMGKGKGKGPIGKPIGEKEDEEKEAAEKKQLIIAHFRDKLASITKKKKADQISQDQKPKIKTDKQVMEDEEKIEAK